MQANPDLVILMQPSVRKQGDPFRGKIVPALQSYYAKGSVVEVGACPTDEKHMSVRVFCLMKNN